MSDECSSLRFLARFVGWLDSACTWLEVKCGRHLAALAVGCLLFGAAAAVCAPTLTAMFHGRKYVRLSRAPFGFRRPNPLQARILTPAIGYWLHLRGEPFLFVPPAIGMLFLASVYGHYRRRQFSGAASLGMAATLAFSTTTLFLLSSPGYVDTTSFLLLFWCFALPERPILRGSLAVLAFFNHEANLFALPWLLFPQGERKGRLKRTLLLAGICLVGVILLLAWREYAMSRVHVRFSAHYYLRWSAIVGNCREVANLLPLGVFEAFRLFWALPLLAVADAAMAKNWRRALWLTVVVASAGAQLIVGHDTTRLMGWAFPAILAGAEDLRERCGGERFARWLWVLVLLNMLVPVFDVRHVKALRLWPVWWLPFRNWMQQGPAPEIM